MAPQQVLKLLYAAMPFPERIRDIQIKEDHVFISWNKIRYKIYSTDLKVRELSVKNKEAETNATILLFQLLFKNS